MLRPQLEHQQESSDPCTFSPTPASSSVIPASQTCLGQACFSPPAFPPLALPPPSFSLCPSLSSFLGPATPAWGPRSGLERLLDLEAGHTASLDSRFSCCPVYRKVSAAFTGGPHDAPALSSRSLSCSGLCCWPPPFCREHMAVGQGRVLLTRFFLSFSWPHWVPGPSLYFLYTNSSLCCMWLLVMPSRTFQEKTGSMASCFAPFGGNCLGETLVCGEEVQG